MKIAIINGPNLNLLGEREPEIYGFQTFEQYFGGLKEELFDVDFEYYQSNVEGELINKIHELRKYIDGIVINAGGYTHTSVSLADAIKASHIPTVEVHISNPAAREPFRHTSMLARVVVGSVSGFGLESYRLGVLSLMARSART